MATGAELKEIYASWADVNDDLKSALETGFPDFVAGNVFNDPFTSIKWKFKMYVCYAGAVHPLFAYVTDADVETNFHEALSEPVISRLELIEP